MLIWHNAVPQVTWCVFCTAMMVVSTLFSKYVKYAFALHTFASTHFPWPLRPESLVVTLSSTRWLALCWKAVWSTKSTAGLYNFSLLWPVVIGSCLIKEKASYPHRLWISLESNPFLCVPDFNVPAQWCSTQFDANLLYALHAFASTYAQFSLFHSLVTSEKGF